MVSIYQIRIYTLFVSSKNINEVHVNNILFITHDHDERNYNMRLIHGFEEKILSNIGLNIIRNLNENKKAEQRP